MAKRGFTLIEVLFVTALTGIVMATSLSLYSFTMTRLGQGTARFTSEDQARKLLDEIEWAVRDSVSVTVVTSGGNTALKCTLAQQSSRTSNASGSLTRVNSAADPIGVTRRSLDRQGTGRRVWFYMSNATGNFGTAGTTVWRAERDDDSTPTGANVTSHWTTYYGTATQRFPLVTALSFSADQNARTATISLTSRMLWRDERTGDASDKMSQTFSETRTIGWRHWFK